MKSARRSAPNAAQSVRVIRSPGGGFSARIHARPLLAGLILALAGLALVCLALASGSYPTSLADVVRALMGQGDAELRMVVTEWRLPRVALAFLLGAALGLSGAIFQSLTRNPLGSPDIIGFSAGSYTGALVVMLLMGGGYYETAVGALIGGILTAGAVWLLAWRQGMQGFRLIVVGIGVAAMLSASNAWMIRDAGLQLAISAALWGAGSLDGLGAEQLLPAALALAAVIPLALIRSRPMRQLEMGDDIARASGVDVNRTRLSLMVLGVALTAIVTATAGPIAFIALASPQIARKLCHSASVTLIPSALTGGVLLLAADLVAQHAFGAPLPVGVMTVCTGGLYFLWLLVREGRK